jgi:hypothetical protein
VVEESRSSKSMLPTLNSTFIALIPKEEANTADKFRPITLCNVIYKIVSKLIANRLKSILKHIISSEQGGFVEGHQILDSIIVAHEAVHSMHTFKKESMLTKLDMSKAYDRISWNFLQKMLEAFGFGEEWVKGIMSLISSNFSSILVNISPCYIIINPLTTETSSPRGHLPN